MPNGKPGDHPKELARSAKERSRLYTLLATVFRREPSVEFLCHLKTPEVVAAFAEAGVDLGDELTAENPNQLADELAVEFTRLFLGPGKHISPHESVQMKRGSGILWGPETSEVRGQYRASGFDLGEEQTEIPDHISVELEFLSRLSAEEAKSWSDQDIEGAAKSLKLQHGFIANHLGKWAPRFCASVAQEAGHPFYLGFADLLRGYLSGEKADIVQRLKSAAAPEFNNEVEGDQEGGVRNVIGA